MTDFQPVLPAESVPSDAERQFIEESPPFFPKNNNSNWGFKRKIFASEIQAAINQQNLMYLERFVTSSEQFLSEWEFLVGIPEAPSSLSIASRRVRVLGRFRNGPFTRSRRIEIIEAYITATFGAALQFSPAGLALVPGGLPLYSDASGDPKKYYQITEEIETFHYTVSILNTVTPDINSLTRDLLRFTPAGISFTIDNTWAGMGTGEFGSGTFGSGTFGG